MSDDRETQPSFKAVKDPVTAFMGMWLLSFLVGPTTLALMTMCQIARRP
jgi:hypothetical protein